MKICDFGCEKEANHQLKNGKFCCSPSRNSCTNVKLQMSLNRKGVKRKPCTNETKKRISISLKLKNKKNTKENMKPFLCEYGCGKEAKYYFKTADKWCCSEFHTKCPYQRKKYKESSKGREPWNKGKTNIFSEESLKIISLSSIKNNTGKHLSEKTKNKISIGNKKPKQSEKFKEEQRQRMLNGQSLKMIKAIKKISREEIKLRDLVKVLYSDCEFQFPVFNYSLDIAIPEYKIAIEFDGYYHFNCQENVDYHTNRRNKIINEGWKFYRVTMFDKFPTLDEVKENIERLINDITT